MSKLFLSVLNMSIAASWLVLAVLLLRLVLKKAPKWLTVVLWAVVAVRLICPVSIESDVSLIPSAQTIPPTIMTDAVPEIHTGIYAFNSAVNPVLQERLAPTVGDSVNPLQIWVPVAAAVWGIGLLAMLVYGVVSYFRVKRKVQTAVFLHENLYQSEAVASPFVLGFLRPRIYLPFCIDIADMSHVIAHEQAHIRRKDHWWKPIGFAILALHWFNPLMWLGYVLLCRDIELACDEKVVKTLGAAERADYSQALLHCSVGRRTIAACPLAFGEVSVKDRVKSVLSYKKPAFWILLVGLVLSVVLAVCFLTNPKDEVESSERNAPVAEEIPSVSENPLDIDTLREKFPMYFDLGTFKGLEVYIWQMAEGSYSCGVLPGVNRNYTPQEILALHKNSASLEEMQAIIAYYLEEGRAVKEDITLVPVTMPHSSYAYVIDEAYRERLNALFWSGPRKTIEGNFRTYYMNSDGTWQYNGYIYKYRLVIKGRMPNSEVLTTYVYLSNIEHISFERAMWASGLSSQLEAYFTPEEAVLVDIYTGETDMDAIAEEICQGLHGAEITPVLTSFSAD